MLNGIGGEEVASEYLDVLDGTEYARACGDSDENRGQPRARASTNLGVILGAPRRAAAVTLARDMAKF